MNSLVNSSAGRQFSLFFQTNFSFWITFFCTEWGDMRKFWMNPRVHNEFSHVNSTQFSAGWTPTQLGVPLGVFFCKLKFMSVSRVKGHKPGVCCMSVSDYTKMKGAWNVDQKQACLLSQVEVVGVKKCQTFGVVRLRQGKIVVDDVPK